jgi:hypothetical protein
MSIKKQKQFIGNNISRLAMEYIGLSTGLQGQLVKNRGNRAGAQNFYSCEKCQSI